MWESEGVDGQLPTSMSVSKGWCVSACALIKAVRLFHSFFGCRHIILFDLHLVKGGGSSESFMWGV